MDDLLDLPFNLFHGTLFDESKLSPTFPPSLDSGDSGSPDDFDIFDPDYGLDAEFESLFNLPEVKLGGDFKLSPTIDPALLSPSKCPRALPNQNQNQDKTPTQNPHPINHTPIAENTNPVASSSHFTTPAQVHQQALRGTPVPARQTCPIRRTVSVPGFKPYVVVPNDLGAQTLAPGLVDLGGNLTALPNYADYTSNPNVHYNFDANTLGNGHALGLRLPPSTPTLGKKRSFVDFQQQGMVQVPPLAPGAHLGRAPGPAHPHASQSTQPRTPTSSRFEPRTQPQARANRTPKTPRKREPKPKEGEYTFKVFGVEDGEMLSNGVAPSGGRGRAERSISQTPRTPSRAPKTVASSPVTPKTPRTTAARTPRTPARRQELKYDSDENAASSESEDEFQPRPSFTETPKRRRAAVRD